ncbi:hypothetical protein DAI22_11g109000 [Oryza sativa Japonica Group]|nr:hypothetical protein DAI22_11g109000 [Oryza sativa Japonica Group]
MAHSMFSRSASSSSFSMATRASGANNNHSAGEGLAAGAAGIKSGCDEQGIREKWKKQTSSVTYAGTPVSDWSCKVIEGVVVVLQRCGCVFCYACVEMSPEKENTALEENQQMEEDGKLIQESLRDHQ